MTVPLSSCLVSVTEASYLVFMFFFFKTTLDFNVLTSPDHFLLKHLVGNEKGLRICLLGRILAVPATVLLLARCRFPEVEPWIRRGVYASMPLSLMNINAVVYLAPIWLTELFILPRQN